jgi:ABC-type sugar transport system ATPase subunit
VSTQRPAVEFRNITKRFPGVVALEDVSVSIAPASCHALCGENGAGKSTLGKVLAGIIQPDEGMVVLDGTPVRFASPTQALRAGVAIVHQELAFCENLSVAENLTLGRLPGRAGFLSHQQMRNQARAMLATIEADIDVDRLVGDLTTGQQQMIQIAAALGRGARIVVFDEPTSSLSQHEAERLFRTLGELRRRGVTSIYVSHRIEEIFRLADAVTILRDGRHVATRPTSSLDEATLIQLMIGRRIDQYFPKHAEAQIGQEVLAVDGLSGPGGFRDVSFRVHAGEILGLAGLVGSGRSELARAIFGIDSRSSGEMRLRGQRVDPATPADAIRLGIGLVPEDRKRQGLVLPMTGRSNGALAILGQLSRHGFLSEAIEAEAIAPYVGRLHMRSEQLRAPVASLSGGNQQKVVLMKWLAARCPVLIVDEPTRGVDVGAKAEIHALIDELAMNGTAIILISSEMPEVLNLSRRILVFRDGRVAGEVPRSAASPEVVMRLMAGVAA